MNELERRYLTREIRMHLDGDQRHIVGYAAVFNSLSEEMFGFQEEIEPGTFLESIEQDDIRGLFNHDPNLILGRNTSSTLQLVEDEIGLRYDITLPDTQYARDLATSMDRGDVDRSSFGFRALEDEWRIDDGVHIRKLIKARLFDVSPVTFPAYPVTTAEIRSRFSEPTGQGPGDHKIPVDSPAWRRRVSYLKRHAQLRALE